MIDRRSVLKFALALPFIGAGLRPAFAKSAEIFNTGGLAINGYDPVAYFTQGKPVSGDAAFAVRWMGVTWNFSSEKNMMAFEADPHKYEPQYGGYCAYAMSQGAIANTVPEAWTIHEDKLYLNFSTGVRGVWQKDIPGHIALANTYWPQILNS